MKKIKKSILAILTGVMLCMAPAPAMAASGDAMEIVITDNEIDSLLSDPDKAADIILYAKDFLDGMEISDNTVLSAIQAAEEVFQISLTDSEEQNLVNIVKKIKDVNIDEEELRSTVAKVYDKMNSMGIDKGFIKSVFGKAVEVVKSFLE